ncbi:hypothetical protein [Siminovitchia sp. 179-K 8D1 HS]
MTDKTYDAHETHFNNNEIRYYDWLENADKYADENSLIIENL